ncbi:hypothetical protein HYW74_04280 [Candidatus Pacearchaeota archaeon]|nr:hypothetical protein [Candidatus Pacearchaeota archaeon]
MKNLVALFASAIIILGIMLSISAASMVSAVEIGISPAQLEFKADAGQEVCKKVSVYSGEDENLIGSDKWSSEKTFVKDIRKYTLSANGLGITFKYPKEVYAKRQLEFNVCISGNKAGTYYGSLIYSTNKSAAVGTWIILKVNGNAAEENEIGNESSGSDGESVLNKITGAVSGMSTTQLAMIPMLTSTLVLVIVLIYMLSLNMKLNAKIEKKEEKANKKNIKKLKRNI